MRNFIVTNGFMLILLVLMVNANDKVEVKKGADSNTEDLAQYVERLINGESEKSAKPELGILQKPMLLKKNTAKSETDESSMKHMKLLPESENVLKHESARHKVTSANDNVHNKAVSPSFIPLLQNDSTLIHHGHTIISPTTKENKENLPLSPPELSKNHLKIPEMLKESSTPNSNEIEEITIEPIDMDVVTDILNSVLLGTTESDTTEALTELYPEDVVTDVVVVEDLDNDGIDVITDEPEPETSTSLFTETTMENPLLEALTELEKLELEAATLLANTSILPVDRFDYFVIDDNSNIPCILMRMNVTLSIPYETKDQKHTTVAYQLPNELLITGNCGNENSSMTISWSKDSSIDQDNNITLNFVKDNASFYVDSIQVNIAVDSHNFPNAKDAYISGNSSTNLKLFSTPVQNGIYVCSAETKVACGKIVATINNVSLIAFNKDQEFSNRTEENCNTTSEYDQELSVSSIIGGIVGALIALAIIVTLFSWCRRRSDMNLRSELP